MTEALDPGAPRGAPFLTVSEIRKSFGGVQALKGVEPAICAPAKCMAWSAPTAPASRRMIRILAGLDRPDSGRIEIDGQPDRRSTTPIGPRRWASSFIHQELALVPRMNALENIMLGAPKESRFGMLSLARRRRAGEADRRTRGHRLSAGVADLQAVDGRALAGRRSAARWCAECRLIVMDEPTASLSVHEVERLFAIIRELSRANVAVLYVSHRLDEITTLCHRVTVFRDGQSVMQADRDRLTRRDLVEAIVGGAVHAPERGPARPRDGAARSRDPRRSAAHPHVRGVTLDLHARRGARPRRPRRRRAQRTGAHPLRRRSGGGRHDDL